MILKKLGSCNLVNIRIIQLSQLNVKVPSYKSAKSHSETEIDFEEAREL